MPVCDNANGQGMYDSMLVPRVSLLIYGYDNCYRRLLAAAWCGLDETKDTSMYCMCTSMYLNTDM